MTESSQSELNHQRIRAAEDALKNAPLTPQLRSTLQGLAMVLRDQEERLQKLEENHG